MAVLEPDGTFHRSIHNIQNTPFRSKFEHDLSAFVGKVGIGVISDTDPQPLVMSSKLGTFAVVTVGLIANIEELKKELFSPNCVHLQYSTTSGMVGQTEIISALIATRDSIVEGLQYVHEKVKGSISILLIESDGTFYASRDKWGRTPIVIGKKDGAMIALQESCALQNLGFEHVRDLGPGEVVKMTADSISSVVQPGRKMAIC